MNDTIFQAASLIIPLVFAIVFHEVSHGLAARALGDPTAAEMKRLSLNPLRHVDLVGTVILPGLLALMKAPVFGWARPVPVNQRRLRNPRRDMMLVAAAGPGSNLVMALVGALALGLLMRIQGVGNEPVGAMSFVAANLINFILINIFLALFNLIPIPPFDGSHIMEGLLPDDLARSYAGMRRHGFMLVLLLLVIIPSFLPAFDPVGWIVVPPVQWLSERYLELAAAIARG